MLSSKSLSRDRCDVRVASTNEPSAAMETKRFTSFNAWKCYDCS